MTVTTELPIRHRARSPYRSVRTRIRDSWVRYAFLAPTLAALTLGFVVPAVDIVRRSLSDGTIASDGEFVGADNYVNLFRDTEFLNAIRVTTSYAIGTVFGTLVLGLLVALMLNQPFRGRTAARTLLIVPWAMPLVPAALVWQWALDPEFGIVRGAWTGLGLGDFPQVLGDPFWALPTVVAIQIWRYLPFAALMYLAGLQSIPIQLYEAARTDGAGPFRTFANVTLPGLRRITTVLTLLIGIWSFGTAMTIVYLLTHGGPAGATELLSLMAYTKAFDQFKFGTASTVGTVVLAISGIFAIAYLSVVQKREA
jgi:multiple sugar transport system permease protein